MRIQRPLFLIILAFAWLPASLAADTLRLDGQPIVRMARGDNPDWSKPEAADGDWRLSALPFGQDDLAFLGKQEGEVSWYRLHFRIDTVPPGNLGLSLGKIADADETWLNGTRIGGTAVIGDPGSHACNKARLYELPAGLLRPGDNVIAIRAKNTIREDEPPGRGEYLIAPYRDLLSTAWIGGMRDLVFPLIYLVCFGYFLLLFLTRPARRENLWFSLFALGFSVYSFCRTDIKYSLVDSFELLQKLEFGSLYLTVPLLMAFILTYFGQRHRFFHYGYHLLSLGFAVAVLLMPNHLDWYRFNVNVVQYTWILPLGSMLWVLVRQVRSNPDARIMLGAFVVILLGALHDILLSRGNGILPFVNFWLTPLSMFLFVMGLSAILAARSSAMVKEIETLNTTLERKVADRTAELNGRLEEIRVKDAKIEKELSMAGRVQESLLPRIPASCPCRVAVRYQPLRQVSGDFYDYLPTPDGGHVLLVADVSGHGMPAAIYTILAKKAFIRASHRSSSPAGILGLVNDELCGLDTGQFLTAFLVKFHADGRLSYANAGHPRAVYLSRSRRLLKLLDTPGSCVGAREDASGLFRDAHLEPEPGDTVLLYTDCLLERSGPDGEAFGEERLVDTVRRLVSLDPERLLDQTLRSWQTHAGGSENKDDLTLLALHLPECVPAADG